MGEVLLSSDEKIQFDRDGYLIKRNVYERSELAHLTDHLNSLWLQQLYENEIHQDKKRPLTSLFQPIQNPHLRYDLFSQWILDPRHFQLVEQLFDEESLIVGGTFFYKPPCTSVLPIHQDNYDIGSYPKSTCAVWVSVDASNQNNGGLMIVPGSHYLGLQRPNHPGHQSEYGQTVKIPPGFETVNIDTNPGDVVLFHGDVLHGSNSNRSRYDFRRAFVIHFTRASTEKIYVMQNQLLSKNGEKQRRALNKKHAIQRLFIEETMNKEKGRW